MTDLYTRVRTHPVLGRIFRFRPLAIVAAVLLVLATATATAEAPTGSVIYGRVKAQDVRLSMPPTNEPKGIAIFFHGQNGGVDNRMDEPWLQSLVRSGWIVASSDFHTDSWGNEASTEDTESLVDWVEEQTDGRADPALRLRLDGRSRLAQRDDPRRRGAPPCWYGVKPAVDLDQDGQRARRRPDHPRGLRRRRALRPQPGQHHRPDADPDPLPDGDLARGHLGPRESENTGRLADGLEARGAEVSILTVHGTHDDPSHFDAEDLVDFAESCADLEPTTEGGGTANASRLTDPAQIQR